MICDTGMLLTIHQKNLHQICVHLNNLIPVTQGHCFPPLVTIGPLVLEKTIFKLSQCIFAISLPVLSLLGKGRFVPSFVDIVPVSDSGEEDNNLISTEPSL
mgnify:CR=1 FL=1